ncbi:MAG: alcohol dehydrogenase catalytic domain-containing protein [Saprospiraceae bacterium]|nr:alcohol dehydrogenase catalytic domain-containing protein [Saprospiraceae bacterium]
MIGNKMQAVYYDQFGQTPIVKLVEVPVIGPGSVLLRVRSTGICRSDWHGWMGHDKDIALPHVPGHEFSGTIEEIGDDVRGWTIGQRVTAPFIQACGKCHYCLMDEQQVCEEQEQAGFTYWGSFAEYLEVKNAQSNLIELPEAMSYDVAAVMGCRFGTAYRAVIDQARMKEGEYLLIIGCGGVGLSAMMIARAVGVRVAAVDVNPQALQVAATFGAEILFERLDSKTITEITEWSGRGVHVCLDAIGRPELLDGGLRTLKRRGSFVQVGLLPDVAGVPSLSMERLVGHELEIRGSHGIQGWKYQEMLDFVVRYEVPVGTMITHITDLKNSIPTLIEMGQNRHFGVTIIHP